MQFRRHWCDSSVKEIPWSRDRLPTPVFLGFPVVLEDKESTCNARDLGSVPVPRGGHGHPLQYSCLEDPQWQKSLVGDSPWGRKESDMTETLSTAQLSKRSQGKARVYLGVPILNSVLTIWWCPGVESALVLLEEGVCCDQCVLLAEVY